MTNKAINNNITLWVFVWDPSFMLKSYGVVGGGWVVAYRILVSAQALVTVTEPESLSLSH